MRYVLTGRMSGQIGPDLVDALAGSIVKVHRVEVDGATRDAGPEELFRLQSEEETRAREYRVIGRGHMDDDGRFVVELDDGSLRGPRGSTHSYDGGPVEVDVCCLRVAQADGAEDSAPVQFTVARIRPQWSEVDGANHAGLAIGLPREMWSQVRAALGAWVVAGRILDAKTRAPLAGLRVHAFDADVVEDDELGSASTDAEGRFRIDFAPKAFRRTPGRRLAEYEVGGPDLYFRVDAPDGSLLIAEERSRGGEPDRSNVASCFYTELDVTT